jgi:predicted metal-dependent hydrolase
LTPIERERFEEGVRLFNRHEFFECHDVLEELWAGTAERHRPFLQGLIQAAVGLFHFEGGNLGGARRMYHSACRYLAPYGDRYLGVDLKRFRAQFQRCFRELIDANDHSGYPAHLTLNAGDVPVLEYSPDEFAVVAEDSQ